MTGVALLLSGETALAVARRLGVNPRTIFRWKRDPRFIAEIEHRAGEMMPRVDARAGAAGVRPVNPARPASPASSRPAISRHWHDEDERWVAEMTRRTVEHARSPHVAKGPGMSRNVIPQATKCKTNPT
jgi:transposase-like protein